MKADESSTGAARAGPGTFTTTHWSVVLAAGQEDSTLARQALEKLCRIYWFPLYAYLRRRGCTEHDAQDLTQGFFAHLLQRAAFGAVAPGRGKFRSFLLASLNHFLADQFDRQQAQKRGGGKSDFSFDVLQAEQHYQTEMVDGETPETLFERRWAIAVLDAAMARMKGEYESAGKGRLFEQLAGYLVAGVERRPYAEVAPTLGLNDEAARKAVQRLRQSFRKAIREEIAQTVASPAEVDEELRHLWSVLSS